MRLACKLKSKRAAIQGAHDDVMKVLETEEVMREATPDRRGVWDTRVKDLCLQILSVADKEIMVRKWKGQLGGPIMDEDFEKWHLVTMRQRWTRMTEGRSKARGVCVCLLLQYLLQGCPREEGGGGDMRTCAATRDYEPRPV